MGSRRFSSRATRDLHLEQLVSPLPELGLVAADGPNDPDPELVVEHGRIAALGLHGCRRHTDDERYGQRRALQCAAEAPIY